jgi:hypothetical protein
MKTHQIEVQRVKALTEAHGLVNVKVDALVQALALRDEGTSSSVLSMSVDSARTLLLLLKAQLAEVDKRKGRSQR